MQIFNIEIIMLKDILKGFSTYLKGLAPKDLRIQICMTQKWVLVVKK